MLVRLLVISVGTLLLAGSVAAIPEEGEFRQIKKGKNLVLRGCSLFDGVRRVKITAGGRRVALAASMQRELYKLPQRYRFFACAADELGVYKLYLKVHATSGVEEFAFSSDDFPKLRGPQCRTFPGGFIYKTIGSSHFTDIRRNTIGLILSPGASGPFPECVSVKDLKGNTLAKLGLWGTGDGWAARYYAGIGCGTDSAFNGAAIAARAQARTGSPKIYFDFGPICYGPIDASRCIGSTQC